MDETYGTYNILVMSVLTFMTMMMDTDHDTTDDTDDDTDDDTNDDTDDGGRGNRRPLPGGAELIS